MSMTSPEWYDFINEHHRSFLPPDFPVITTLCGSTRFKDAWFAESKRLTHEGKIVLSVGDLDQSEANRTVNVPLDPELKAKLDVLHTRKIDISDEVLILNVGGYVGSSTRNELKYAIRRGKRIRYLEPPSAELERAIFAEIGEEIARDEKQEATA